MFFFAPCISLFKIGRNFRLTLSLACPGQISAYVCTFSNTAVSRCTLTTPRVTWESVLSSTVSMVQNIWPKLCCCRIEDICWVKTNKCLKERKYLNATHQRPATTLHHVKEHCLVGRRGDISRKRDSHFVHSNLDVDVILSEEPELGSLQKPEELYSIIERFCLGRCDPIQHALQLRFPHSETQFVLATDVAQVLTCESSCDHRNTQVPNFRNSTAPCSCQARYLASNNKRNESIGEYCLLLPSEDTGFLLIQVPISPPDTSLHHVAMRSCRLDYGCIVDVPHLELPNTILQQRKHWHCVLGDQGETTNSVQLLHLTSTEPWQVKQCKLESKVGNPRVASSSEHWQKTPT